MLIPPDSLARADLLPDHGIVVLLVHVLDPAAGVSVMGMIL